MKKTRILPQKQAMPRYLISIILVAFFALILLILFGFNILPFFQSQGDIEACRTAVLARSKATALLKEKINLPCQTRVIKIEPQAVYLDRKKILDLSSDEIKRREQVVRVIAEELRLCKYQFPVNGSDVWNDWKSHQKCIICSEIFIDDDFPHTIGGLKTFMDGTKLTHSDQTYSHFVYGSQGMPEYQFLQPGQSYVVVFAYIERPGIFQINFHQGIFLLNSQHVQSEIHCQELG